MFQGIKRVQKEVIEESDKCGPEKKHLVKAKKVLPPVRNNIQTRKSSRKMETIAEEVMSDPDVDMAESESKMADLLEFENPVIIEPVEDILDIEETNSLPSLLPSSSLHRTPADEFLKDELDKSLEEN